MSLLKIIIGITSVGACVYQLLGSGIAPWVTNLREPSDAEFVVYITVTRLTLTSLRQGFLPLVSEGGQRAETRSSGGQIDRTISCANQIVRRLAYLHPIPA